MPSVAERAGHASRWSEVELPRGEHRAAAHGRAVRDHLPDGSPSTRGEVCRAESSSPSLCTASHQEGARGVTESS